MVKIDFVITNGGDGSNGIRWVLDPAVIEVMEQKAEDGDDTYASGDGLQVTTLVFPDDFDLGQWMLKNNLRLTTLEDMKSRW